MVNNISYNKIYKREAIKRFPELYDSKYEIKNMSVYSVYSIVNKKMKEENINLSNLRKYLEKEVTTNILYEPTNEVTNSILDNYNGINDGIAKYKFSEKSKNLGRENDNNKQVLIMLSLLKGNILRMLSDIDYYINTQKVTDASLLMIRLSELDSYLRFIREELEISEHRYHKIWNNIYSNTRHMTFTKHDLGVARRDWFKWKTNAVSDLIATYKKLLDLDQMVIDKAYGRYEANKKIYSYSEFYQAWLDDIKSSDNYYSYIDSLTRKSEIEKNTLRKQKRYLKGE